MCRNATRIQVELGGITKVITPSRDLPDGESSTYPCAEVNPSYNTGSIVMECHNGHTIIDLDKCKIREGPAEEQCQEIKEILTDRYEESIKRITQEINLLEAESRSPACEAAARQTHQSNITPLEQRREELSKDLNLLSIRFESYRSQIQSTAEAERQLREDIIQTAQRCDTMDETVDSLDRVRNAIHILNLCPGLGNLDLSLPQWVGTWIVLDVKRGLRDAEVDDEMSAMCRGLPGASDGGGGGAPRAAETSEIQQAAVEGAPETNTALVPLMGTCPGCEGIPDTSSGIANPSGHARICWDPESTLNEAGRRTDCGAGRKAIMCVLDKRQ
jgi:hypothetical protein